MTRERGWNWTIKHDTEKPSVLLCIFFSHLFSREVSYLRHAATFFKLSNRHLQCLHFSLLPHPSRSSVLVATSLHTFVVVHYTFKKRLLIYMSQNVSISIGFYIVRLNYTPINCYPRSYQQISFHLSCLTFS